MRCNKGTLGFRCSSSTPTFLTAIAVLAIANPVAPAARGVEETGDQAVSSDAGAADVFWIVSSRGVGDPESNPAEALNALRFYQAHTVGGWSSISRDDLTQAVAGDQPVVVWIHGNRMDFRDSVRSAAALQRVLNRLVPDRRYVLVAWSWPADQMIRGIRQDSRLKSCRSEQEAALLAQWIEQTLRHRTVVLVGYSFGAQTALKTAALLTDSQLPEGATVTTPPPQSAAIASSGSGALAAMLSGDWMGATCPVEALFASTRSDALREDAAELHLRLLATAAACPAGSLAAWLSDNAAEPEFIGITVNQRDPALRWYTHLWSHRGPQALGAVGPYGIPSAIEDAVMIQDVTCQVGRTHDWEAYLCSPGFRELLRKALAGPTGPSSSP